MLKNLEFSPSVSILVAGALIAGAIVFINLRPASAELGNGALPASTIVPPPSPEDHIVGSPEAPIVLIEYSDFQCYYCMQAYPTFKKIVDESGGKVAWVMRNLPLDTIHPEARPAGLAAECIAEQLGNTGWWGFADSLFTDQTNLGNARYLALASELGADTGKFLTCLSSKKYNEKLDQQSAEAQIAGATGTPYTVVYGYGAAVPLSGALPYAQFAAVIKALQARQ